MISFSVPIPTFWLTGTHGSTSHHFWLVRSVICGLLMHPSRGQHAEKCVNKKSLIVFCFSNSQGVAFPWVCRYPCFSWVDKCFFVLRGSIMPLGSEYDEEEVDYEESDSDESWTTESAISSESILSSMSMNGADEKPFACPVPGCKKRYKVRLNLRAEQAVPRRHEVLLLNKSTLELLSEYHMCLKKHIIRSEGD